MNERMDGNTFRGEYSYEEWLGVFDMPFVEKSNNFRGINKELNSFARWYGGLATAEKAIALARDGWPKGESKLLALSRSLSDSIPPTQSIRRRGAWREEGSDLDVDRALRGEWDTAWRGTAPRFVTASPIVDVVVPVHGNCSRNADELFWAPACALALADSLEAAGYRCKLVAVYRATDTDRASFSKNTDFRVTLKEPGEPLRMSLLASQAHAGVKRWMYHALYRRCPFQVNSGLGTSVKESPDSDELCPSPFPLDEISACARLRELIAKVTRR